MNASGYSVVRGVRLWLGAAGWGFVATAITALYASVASLLVSAGSISPATLFVIEEANVAAHAVSPLVGLLLYPPLPVAAYALLHDPALASAVVAMLATVSLLWFAFHRTGDALTALLLSASLLVPALTADALGSAPFWAFAALLSWALYLIARYAGRDYSLYLFQAGLQIAAALFIDVRAALVAAFAAAALFILFLRDQRARGLSVAIVLLFPIAYGAAAWSFLQLVFTGHGWPAVSPLGFRAAWQAYPVALAYLLALTGIALAPRADRRRYLLAVFFALPLAALTAASLGVPFTAGELVLLATAGVLAAVTQIAAIWLRRAVAGALLAAMLWLPHVLAAIPPQRTATLPAILSVGEPAWLPDVWNRAFIEAHYVVAVLFAAGVLLLARHCALRLTGRVS